MKICGFILAAGMGTRLRTIFPDIPKPLVPVAGKPAISWAMEILRETGAERIIVNTHYQRERMKKELPPLAPPGIELLLSEEETLLGTGGGILKAREGFLSYDWLVVINADILTDFRPGTLLKRLEKDKTEAHLVCSESGPVAEMGKIGLMPSGKVWFPGQADGDKTIRKGVFMGLHVIRPSVLGHIKKEGPVSIIEIYRQLIGEGKKIRGSFTRKFWVDLGTEDGYRRALQHLSERPERALQEQG